MHKNRIRKKTIRMRMKKEYVDDEKFIRKWNGASSKDRHIIVVDEFGNTAHKEIKDNESKFGYGVSNVNHPDDYAKISRNNRKKHGNDEQKAGKSSLEERKKVSTAIRKTKTKTACVYVDKRKEMPKYMESDKKYERILGLLNDTLDETLPKTGAVWVVIDHNTQYRGNAKIKHICSALSNKKRTVYGRQYVSEGDTFPSDLLQTNDYVANAARSKVELGDETRTKILRMRFKLIGSRKSKSK